MVRFENNSHMLVITLKGSFLRLLKLFGSYSLKVIQTWFVSHKPWHTILFGVNYFVEMVRIEKNSYMLKIMC